MIYLAIIGLAFICFASTSVLSFQEFSRHQLEEICERWGKQSRLSRIIKKYERMAIASEHGRAIAMSVTVFCGFSWLFRLRLLELESEFLFFSELGFFVLL